MGKLQKFAYSSLPSWPYKAATLEIRMIALVVGTRSAEGNEGLELCFAGLLSIAGPVNDIFNDFLLFQTEPTSVLDAKPY